MTPRQKQLVRDSFASVKDLAEPLAQLFYGRLFESYPQVRPMFGNDMRAQGRKLMATIDAAIEALDDFDRARPMLRELGRRHLGFGAEPEHYELVMSCLIWALGQGIGLNAEQRQAWTAAITAINTEMLLGAVESVTDSGAPPAS